MQNKITRPEFINILRNYCYHNYKWNLDNLTKYTHRAFNKLLNPQDDNYITSVENSDFTNKLLLEGMRVDVSLANLKIVTISIYVFTMTLQEILAAENTQLSDYYTNLEVCQKYIDKVNNTNSSNSFVLYQFKIIDSDGIFTFMDSNYNLISINDSIVPEFITENKATSRLHIKEFVDGILVS
jgi:hypothetical protein